MPTFQLTTPSGTEHDASRARIAEALDAADRAGDPAHFAVVTREDGIFVQLAAGGPLEVGGAADHPHRLDHAALARGIVERLARGEDPWGELPHRDLSDLDPVRRRDARRSRLFGSLAILAFALFVAAMCWIASR